MTQSLVKHLLLRMPTKVKVLSCLAFVSLMLWAYDQHIKATIHGSITGRLTGPNHLRDESSGQKTAKDLEGSIATPREEGRPPYKTQWKDFLSRKKRVENVCRETAVPGGVHGVYNHSSGVLYCFVPKAGCTFWKRVFKAAQISQEDPFAISRNLIHSAEGTAMKFSPKLHTPDRYPTRFLVTRDPFSRLLSAYLDKFYLVDFWPSESKPMVNKRPAARTICGSDFLRVHFEKMASRFDRQNNGSVTQNETRCGKYVTFFEFVRDGFDRKEPHWMPIHEICNPCLLNVTHVAHMESFTEDARVILAKMVMEHILEDTDHNKQVDDEIQTIIDYNFNKTHETELAIFFKQCVTPTELAFRLWNNFRWRGYIDPDVSYVIPDFTLESRVKEDLIVQIARARQSGLSNPARMKQAKDEFRDKAFQTIPKELFQNLTKKYSLDFKLFGYEDVRDRLFHSLFQLSNSDRV